MGCNGRRSEGSILSKLSTKGSYDDTDSIRIRESVRWDGGDHAVVIDNIRSRDMMKLELQAEITITRVFARTRRRTLLVPYHARSRPAPPSMLHAMSRTIPSFSFVCFCVSEMDCLFIAIHRMQPPNRAKCCHQAVDEEGGEARLGRIANLRICRRCHLSAALCCGTQESFLHHESCRTMYRFLHLEGHVHEVRCGSCHSRTSSDCTVLQL